MSGWLIDWLRGWERESTLTLAILAVWFGFGGFVVVLGILQRVKRWRSEARSEKVTDIREWLADSHARPRW